MLNQLFKYPTVLKRHRCAPFLKERERYLVHKANHGYAHETLLHAARELFWIARSFGSKGCTLSKVTREDIRKAAAQWAQNQYLSGRAERPKQSCSLFVQVATDWFRFLDLLHEPIPKQPWYDSYIQDFATFMETERGLSPQTIRSRYWQVERFLGWVQPHPKTISSIRVTDVDRFLKTRGTRHWSRVSVDSSAKALRAFFRHAAMRGWCASEVAESIHGPRLFAQETIPLGPSWEDVERLLASMDTEQPVDIRDRAIVLFFALYGMRSSEVANLRLQQINWNHNQITFVRKKRRLSEAYPLIPVVGNTLVKYLQTVRPRCPWSEVFLTLKAPIKPMSAGSLYHSVSKRMANLGILGGSRGPHALRHACATHLLAEGLSLKEIADHLGHARTSSTRIYAKVDMPHLREVAVFNFGGAL